MSLQVWLPLTGDLHNQGLSNVTATNNGATVDNNGKIGKCYSFNGSNNYISLTNINCNAWPQCTVAFWCYPTNSFNYLFLIRGSGAHRFGISGDGLSFRDTNHSNQAKVSFNTTIDINKWDHIACVYNRGEVSMYVNGILTNHSTTYYNSTSVLLSDLNEYRIARRQSSSSDYYYAGRINDFRIYDNALSAQEVKEISKGLVLHYPLNRSNWGNPNMITKSMLSSTPWSNAITGTENYKGRNAILVHNSTLYTKTSKGTTSVFPSMTFEENTQYTLSLYWCDHLRTDSYSSSMYLRFWYTDGTYTQIISPAANTDAEWTYNHMTSTAGKTVEMIRTTYGRGGTISIADFKIEKGSVKTGYSPPIDELGTTEYDTSGFQNNGTKVNSFSYDQDTAKYKVSTVFDGDTAAIQTPNLKTLISDSDYTISVWVNKAVIGTKNYQTIYGGPSGFELEARSSSSTSPLFRIHNWGGGTTAYAFNTWNHFCFVHSSTDSKLYVNGELKITGTSVAIPSGNYFIGAWKTATQQNFEGKMSDFRIYATSLTADDVLAIYQHRA